MCGAAVDFKQNNSPFYTLNRGGNAATIRFRKGTQVTTRDARATRDAGRDPAWGPVQVPANGSAPSAVCS